MPYSSITHDSRHPFQLAILAAGVIGGIFALLGDFWPRSIEAAFSSPAQQVWGVLFGGGASLALAGSLLRRRDIGILLEQVGLASFGGACLTYASALLVYSYPTSAILMLMMLFLGLASAWRWRDLQRFIKLHIGHARWLRKKREAGE